MINGRLQSSLTLTINSPQQQTYKSARYRPHPPSRHVCNPLAYIYFVILMQFNFLRTSNGVPITTAPTAIAAHHNYLSSPSTAASRPSTSSASSSPAFAADAAPTSSTQISTRTAWWDTMQEGTLPWVDLHDEVTPFEYGAPGGSANRARTIQCGVGTSLSVP